MTFFALPPTDRESFGVVGLAPLAHHHGMGEGSEREARLAEVLRARRDRVLKAWAEAAAELQSAQGLREEELLDHIPDLLDWAAEAVDRLSLGTTLHPPQVVAVRHIQDRLPRGFDLAEVLEELAILRRVLFLVWEQEGEHEVVRAGRMINQAIDEMSSAAARYYLEVRTSQIEAMDRVSLAAGESRSHAELCESLLGVLAKAIPVMEVAVVLLLKGDTLCAASSRGLAPGALERIVEERLRLLEILGAARAAQSGTFLLSEGAPGLEFGVPALFGAALVAGSERLGFVVMGTSAPAGFTLENQRLLAALAHRAAAAIRQRYLRDEAEQRAAEAERAFELLEHAEAFMVLDRDWNICRMNASMERLSGRRRAALIGERLWEALPELQRHDELRRAYEGVMKTRQPAQLEVWDEARAAWFDVSVSPAENGGLVVFSRDTTARHESEAALRSMERLLQVHPDFFYVFDREHRMQYVSPALLRLWGTTAEEARGKTFAELGYPPELVEEHRRQLERAFGGESVRDENWYRDRNGTPRRYEYIFAPVGGEGEEVRAVVGVTRDVTARHREEEGLRLLAEAGELLASSLDFEATLKAVAQLVVPRLGDWCVVDLIESEGRLRQVALFHRDPEKLQAVERLRAPRMRHRRLPVPLAAGRSALYPELTREILVGLSRDPEYAEALERFGPRSMMIVPLIARGKVLGDVCIATAESGRILEARDLQIAEDLARRIAAAMDNARLFEEAQRATRLREDLLAIVSHDLRNPLGALTMSTHLLAAKLLADHQDPRVKGQLDIIRRASTRMEHLIRDLLDVSSIQAGRLAVELRPADARELLEEALLFHRPLALEKGIRLACDHLPEAVTVSCDRERVLQVLSNILGNAIKFCPPRAAVRLGARRIGDVLEVWVADTGPGIEADELARVFEPYWSGQRHMRQGTGLGLSISRGIIEAHGGQITAESEPGRGSTFRFTLPLTAP